MSSEKKITERGYWECQNGELYKFDNAIAQGINEVFTANGCKSVVDLGCGNGAYTRYLKDHGDYEQLACYDGNPYTAEISNGLCGTFDLTQSWEGKRYDGVLCLEVAEHIPEEYEIYLLSNLKKITGKMLILSWAIPGQGGHGHVNNRSNAAVIAKLYPEFSLDLKSTEKLRQNFELLWFGNTIMAFTRK